MSYATTSRVIGKHLTTLSGSCAVSPAKAFAKLLVVVSVLLILTEVARVPMTVEGPGKPWLREQRVVSGVSQPDGGQRLQHTDLHHLSSEHSLQLNSTRLRAHKEGSGGMAWAGQMN